MKSVRPLLQRCLVGGLLLGCAACTETAWTGFAYPDKSNVPDADQLEGYMTGRYATLDDCRAATKDRLATMARDDFDGDYRCGYRCERKATAGNLLVCEQQTR